MLNIVLKVGDRIELGDYIIIELHSDRRAQLAIDAPKRLKLKDLTPQK